MPQDPHTQIRTFMQAVFGADFPDKAMLANLAPPQFIRGFNAKSLDLDRDCYWSVASFGASARTHALAGALDVRALVIDDVGTKNNAGWVALALGPATAEVETSAGNFQWVYRLTKPVDANWDRVMDGAEKMIGGPPLDGKDAVHLFRLPAGVNTKPGRNGFAVRLAALRPDVALDPDSLVGAPPGPRTRPSTPGHAPGTGTVVDAALEPAPVWDIGRLVGMVKNPLGLDRSEWVAIAHQIKRLAVDPVAAEAAWDEFSSRWGGGGDEAETARVWASLGDVSRTRGGLLIERAQRDAGPGEFEGWVQAEAGRAFDDGVEPPPGGGSGPGGGGGSGPNGTAEFTRDQHRTGQEIIAVLGRTIKHVDGGSWREWNTLTGLWDEWPTNHALRTVMRLADARRWYPLDPKVEKVIGSYNYLASVANVVRTLPEVVASRTDFDRNPFLLGVPSGVVDLGAKIVRRTVRMGRVGELVSRRCAVDPAPPGARGVVWTKFLSEFTQGDAALEEWLQVYAGYSLTGLTREHLMPFFYGSGGNGKSVFLNTLRWVWGDYGVVLDKGLLFEQQGQQHRAFLAMLYGARLGIIADVPPQAVWDTQVVKLVTGGDPITANWMRENPFTFQATCKLIASGQHQPGIRSMDGGMRRRLRMVPLSATPAKVDGALSEKLRETEGSEILRWALDGLDLYWGMGAGGRLPRSKAIEEETKTYMDDQDLFGLWIAKCLKPLASREREGEGVKDRLRAADLFRSWDAFRGVNRKHDADPLNPAALSRRLGERGIKLDRDNQGAYLKGYKLVKSDDFNPF